jgi:hypothetical protein
MWASIGMWLCVIAGTALVCVLGWAAMKYYGLYAMRRDEMEREQLAVEWKRRAAERKAKAEGTLPPAPGQTEDTADTEDNPPLY